jgi:hypothetical protein
MVVPFSQAATAAPSAAIAETDVATEAAEPVEVKSLTTETTMVMAQPDGSFKAEISPVPVRVKRDDQWVPVDATLERKPDGTIAPKAVPSEMSFSNGGTSPLVRLTEDGKSLGFGWPQSLPTPILDGPTATYPEVLEGVDLVVKASVLGYATYFVVKSAQAALNPALAQLRFTLQTSGLTVAEDAHGGIAARDPDGRLVFSGPQPRMWDSTPPNTAPGTARAQSVPGDSADDVTEPGEGAQSAATSLEVTGGAVTVAPDPELLKGADTVYPVVVDPSVVKARSSWGMVWSNTYEFFNHPSEIGRVGYDGWDDPHKVSRSFYRFDISAVTGKHILSATFRHNQVHSPNFDCDKLTNGPGVRLFRSYPFDSGITWPGPGAIQNLTVNTKVHGHREHCPGSTTLEWPIETAVEASNSLLYLGMKSEDESDREGWRKFSTTDGHPVIEIVFNTVPYAPTAPKIDKPPAACSTSATNPAVIGEATPQFSARLTDSDAPTGDLRAHFYVYPASSTSILWNGYGLSSVGNGYRVMSHEVTAGRLTDGPVYRFRVRTEESTVGDGSQIDASPFSIYCYFKVDLHSPTAPIVESTSYPPLCSDPNPAAECHKGTDGVGKPGFFDFSSSASDVVRYEYSFNGQPYVSVPSAGPGLKTRVTLTPSDIDNVLVVRAFDDAAKVSGNRNYVFKARPGAKPVGVWKMNESSGTTAADSSGSSALHPATVSVSGTPGSQWWSGGRLGGSIRMDGVDDYAMTQGPVIPDTTKSFAVSSWVFLESTANYQQVIGQAGTNNQAFTMYYSPAYQNWVFALTGNDATTPSGTVFTSATDRVATGVWTHLTGVYDRPARQIRLYVNGRLVDQATFNGGWDANGVLNIGRNRSGTTTDSFFDGAIDEVKVWDRVLGAGELEPLVNSFDQATNLPAAELAGHWTFESLVNSGDKRLAPDRSGYGRSAELGVGADGGRLVGDQQVDRLHGNVLRLDGGTNDFAKTVGAVVDTSGSFTITAWVRPTDPTRPGPIVAAGSHGSTNPAAETMWLGLARSSPQYWRFERTARDGSSTSERLSRTSVAPAPDASWTHIASVYDSATGTMRLYVDGIEQLINEEPFEAAWHAHAPVWFGAELPGAGRQPTFVGELDNICMYTGVLDKDKIYKQWFEEPDLLADTGAGC